MSSSSVQVVVRLRPMNNTEKKEGTLPVIKAKTQEKSVTVIKGQGMKKARSSFMFDNVFTAFSSQEEVFEATLKPVIRDVMQGYESTVFAYGQTGTGKTYTMEGDLSTPEQYGVIPRSAQSIFEALKKPEFTSHHVVCSYLEIYNEELCDLLADEQGAILSSSSTPMKDRNRSSYASSLTPMKDRSSSTHNYGKKLEIMNGKSGTFCRGLSEKEVHSASDVLELMQRAQHLRKIGETKMNKESSRSHCVFSIIINANKRLSDGSMFEFSGKLHLVDLAGSECAKTAGLEKSSGNEVAQVARERERMNINRSLLTLGRVIKTLKEQSSSSKKSNIRIPYRDSKLTRILQESLGGRCKTLIIATLSPSVTAIEESMSTLNYAQAANGIINKPVSSSYLSLGSSASSTVVSGLTEPNTVEHWQEMECRLEYMQTQVEEAKAALARKHMQQQEIVERAEKAESTVIELEDKYKQSKKEIESLTEVVAKEREDKQVLSNLLQETELALRKTNAILEATQHTETCLTSEAKSILASLEESIRDGDQLHQLLAEARESDIQKRSATKTFHTASTSILGNVIDQLNELSKSSEEHKGLILNQTESEKLYRTEKFSSFDKLLQETKTQIMSLVKEIESLGMGDNGIKEVLAATSSGAIERLDQTKSMVNHAEKELHERIHQTRTKVMKASQDLDERNRCYIKSSDDFLSAFESNVASAKSKISTMVSNATVSLAEVRLAGAETRKNLLSLLNQIETTSKEASASTQNILSTQRDKISCTDRQFGEGKDNLEDMNTFLNGQGSLIDNEGGRHMNQVHDLKQAISDQKNTFNQAYEEEQKLQQEVLQNMYMGMQKLMQVEMKRLTENTMKQQNSFTSSSDSLLQQNENIEVTGRSILGEVKDTNGKLLEKVGSTQANYDSIEEVVQDTKETLAKLEDSTIDDHNAIVMHVEHGKRKCDELDKELDEVMQIGEKMANDNKVITDFTSEKILSESQEEVSKISQEAQNNMDYARNTVVKNVCEDLDVAEAPRGKYCSDVTSNLQQVATSLGDATAEIVPKIEEQSKKSGIVGDTITSYEQTFEEISSDYCNNVQTNEKSLISSTETFETSTSTLVSSCRSSLSGAQTTISDFSVNDIQVDENVPPLISRAKFEYSSNFTSTPADDIILQGLTSSVNDENNDAMSVKSETSHLSSSVVSSKQDPSPLSESSQTSVKIKSYPLGEVVLNKEIISEKKTTVKFADLSKKPRQQSKKRCNPPKRSELRKRVPTTPSRGGKSMKRRRERI